MINRFIIKTPWFNVYILKKDILIKKIPYFSRTVNVNAKHNSWPLGLVSCSRNKLKYEGNPTTVHHGDYDRSTKKKEMIELMFKYYCQCCLEDWPPIHNIFAY